MILNQKNMQKGGCSPLLDIRRTERNKMMKSTCYAERAIYKDYDVKVKIYNNNSIKLTKYAETRTKFIKARKEKDIESAPVISEEEKAIRRDEYLQKYTREVKTRIYDIIRNNEEKFEYFVTFTFDPSEEKLQGLSIDESNESRFQKMVDWLQSQRVQAKRKGKEFSYIIVPELHEGTGENSGKIHFHGLMSADLQGSYCPKLVDSGKKYKGQTIYNITSFAKNGFTNVTKIKNRKAVANYVRKYVTKNLYESKVFLKKGRKRYWSSKNLTKCSVKYLNMKEARKLLDKYKKKSPQFECEHCEIYDFTISSTDAIQLLVANEAINFDVAHRKIPVFYEHI